MVYYFSDDEKERARYTKLLKPLAKTYREYLQLVTIDSADYPGMARDLGLATNRGLSLQNQHNGQVFPYTGRITPEAISEFIVSISKGEIKPWPGHTDKSLKAAHDEL